MADKKKDEAKEPKKPVPPKEGAGPDLKVAKPEDAAEAAPAPIQMRQVVIQTDGRAINLVQNQLSILELREVGRQLMAL